MANIRELKKDVEYIISELISDCYIYIYFNDERNKEKVMEIIEKAVALRNNLFDRINNPVKSENKNDIRNHYKIIYKDLLEGADNLFEELSKLPKK